MDFKDKFIRYHPDITFEIFQLIWDKLHSLGYKDIAGTDINSRFKTFQNRNYLMLSDNLPNYFNTYPSTESQFTEITVEEFLGYNPFTKSVPTTEIESPEYYEYTGNGDGFTDDKIYKIINPKNLEMAFNFIDDKERENGWSPNNHKHFNPSTKEAFDLQEQPKPIESLKQAIHCKTQEEWDFVLSKFNPRGLDKGTWHRNYQQDICITYKNEPNGSIGTYGDLAWYKKENYEIILFEDWCKQNNYVMESKSQFEVGKWYKSNSSPESSEYYYLKVVKILDREIRGEKITIQKEYKEYDIWNNPGTLSQALQLGPLTDLSEIQQYLPDGHPDKIVKSTDFKIGDWVYFMGTDPGLVTSYWPIGTIGKIEEIIDSSYKFTIKGVLCGNRKDQFRLATQQEIDSVTNKVNFKIGDWIITNGYCETYDGKPLHLAKIDAQGYCYFDNTDDKRDNCHLRNIARLATAEELALMTPKVKVDDWVVGPDKVIAKVTKIDLHFLYTTNKYHKYASDDGSDNSWINIKHGGFRLATSEEILSVQPKESVQSTEFVLPEKWYIKVTGECKPEEVFKWRGYFGAGGYVYSSGYWDSAIYQDYTEITLDQFEKYVLKEKVMENKFKIGDYVELIANKACSCNSIGDIGIVEEIHGTDSCRVKCPTTTYEGNWSRNSDLKLSSLEVYNAKYNKSTSKDDLLKEAKRRYPIGTKIYDYRNSEENIVSKTPFQHCQDGIAGGSVNCVLYFQGKWAEIIEESKSTKSIPECPFNEGDLVSCKIGYTYTEGKIHFENSRIYFCNNEFDGSTCRDKLGYDYSWIIYNPNSSASFGNQLEQNGVVNIQLLNKSTSSDSLDDEYNEIFNGKGIREQIKSKPVTYHEALTVKDIERYFIASDPIPTPRKSGIPTIELIKVPKI